MSDQWDERAIGINLGAACSCLFDYSNFVPDGRTRAPVKAMCSTHRAIAAVFREMAAWTEIAKRTRDTLIEELNQRLERQAEQHKAEVEYVAAGSAEWYKLAHERRTEIADLRAELARLKSSDPLETIVKLQEDLTNAEAEIARLKQALGDAQQEPRK